MQTATVSMRPTAERLSYSDILLRWYSLRGVELLIGDAAWEFERLGR